MLESNKNERGNGKCCKPRLSCWPSFPNTTMDLRCDHLRVYGEVFELEGLLVGTVRPEDLPVFWLLLMLA
jgi:hypothetical protein